MEDDDLPVPRDADAIDRLREVSEALQEGEADDLLVPVEAHDVGDDVDVRANPRACDLGYTEAGGECAVASNLGGSERIMYDEGNGDARIDCDAETFVDDVSDWA